MSYDLHGQWDPVTGLHSGLYGRKDDINKTLNVDWAARYMVSLGCPKSKLNLGMGSYGRTFNLKDAASNGIQANASGTAIAGTVSFFLVVII